MFLNIFYQLHQHLRVRITHKRHALGLQLLLQVGIVLDDTVMDDGQVLRFRIMRMGVTARRFTVGCPTGVGNADGAADVLISTIFTKVVNLTFRLIHIQVAIAVDQRHACRVVTTILQTAQALNQNRKSLFLSDITYYSTHNLFNVCVVNRLQNYIIYFAYTRKEVFFYFLTVFRWSWMTMPRVRSGAGVPSRR